MHSEFNMLFNNFLLENLGSIHYKLNKNPEYTEKSKKFWGIRDQLEHAVTEHDTTKYMDCFSVFSEYLELENDLYNEEQLATYFKGIRDCIVFFE